MTAFEPGPYWEERLSRDYSLKGVGHRRLGLQYNRWMYRVRERVFSRLLTGHAIDAAATNVLDVGSGTGFYIEQWQRAGARNVSGIDITAVAVNALAQRWPDFHFVQCDIGAPSPLPFAPGSFDAVTAMDVLFHIVDDQAFRTAISNISGLLRPDGLLIWSDIFRKRAELRLTHQVSRPLTDIERMVDDAGFEIVERRPMFTLMSYPVDARSRLLQLGWQAMVFPASIAEPLGWAVGAGLYPLEMALTGRVKESATTEIMVCRRRT